MKRYQLIGRKKELSSKRSTPKYSTNHIHSLPYEILLEIFQYIDINDTRTFLQLSLCCHKVNTIINKNFLYKHVELNGVRNFFKFANVHIPALNLITKRFPSSLSSLTNPSSKINLITHFEVKNPPQKNTENTKIKIAGTYDVSIKDQNTDYLDFTSILVNIFKESYSIRTITLSEISPQFEFPDSSSIYEEKPSSISFFSKSRTPSKRKLDKLILKAQNGWSIPFKFNHLTSILKVYGEIDELKLNNFVIDELKLDLVYAKQVVNRLTLNSCTFILAPRTPRIIKRNPSSIFVAVSELTLLNILSGKDLSVIDFIKLNNNLRKITIDFKSPVFYDSNMIFNFARYNLFFKLLCSGQGAYSTIKEIECVNFSLLDNYGHTHHVETKYDDGEEDDWIELASDTFESLLSFLAGIPKLTISLEERDDDLLTCIKCGAELDLQKKKNLYSDWIILLKPLLKTNKNCMVEVLDHQGRLLFARSSK